MITLSGYHCSTLLSSYVLSQQCFLSNSKMLDRITLNEQSVDTIFFSVGKNGWN
jgi:hypothetical protein